MMIAIRKIHLKAGAVITRMQISLNLVKWNKGKTAQQTIVVITPILEPHPYLSSST